jgi:hypothetical protein
MGHCVFIVREPLSRFKSLWKQKARDEDVLWDDDKEAILAGMTPEELMDYIEDPAHLDPHWNTQISQCGAWAHELVPLEKLDRWWIRRGLPALPRHNKTEGEVELSEELEERVLKFYKKDVEFYKQAVEYAC